MFTLFKEQQSVKAAHGKAGANVTIENATNIRMTEAFAVLLLRISI
jgi:hypothetical protein